MTALQGTIKNGQIVLDVPVELPEGTRVEVVPIEMSRPMLGMREEDWPTTPEGIAALLTRMEQAEPGWLSPADDGAWRADLKECEGSYMSASNTKGELFAALQSLSEVIPEMRAGQLVAAVGELCADLHASPVRREGRPKPIGLPYPYLGFSEDVGLDQAGACLDQGQVPL